ncbi:membrane protein [Staphylococcus aureus]|nr:membrane protein [Staphylococcus aureus]
MIVTVLLFKPLGDFYSNLDGFLGLLITISPVTMVIGAILLILTAIGIIQAAKEQFKNVNITK